MSVALIKKTIRFTHAATCGYCNLKVRATAGEMEVSAHRCFIWQCKRCGQHIGVEQMKPETKHVVRLFTSNGLPYRTERK